MATTRLTRVQQTEHNRGLVLHAARRVFLERGYAGATVDAIAEDAGFSKGVVYSQFAGKPDLLLALLARRVEERAAENARAAEGLAGLEGLRTLMEANERRSQESPGWPRLLIEFRVVAARDEELKARYAAVHADVIDRFAEAIEAIAARGGLRFVHGARLTAQLVLALDAGVTLERVASPTAIPTSVLHDLMSRLTEPI